MSDLDSFFAKKDKKKGKKAKKFTTTDEIAKKLENPEKKPEKPISSSTLSDYKKEEIYATFMTTEPAPEAAPTDAPPAAAGAEKEPPKDVKPVVEEEQWNDFKEDVALDVSSLKITKLNIEEEEEMRGDYRDGGEEGKESGGEDKKDGVWKVEEQKSIQTAILEAVDAGLDEGLEEVKATVAAMNANARWTSQLSKELQPSPLPRGAGPGARRKKVAPDITNAMAFPSLADAQASSGRRKNQDDRDFTEPQRGGGGSSGSSGLRSLSSRDQGNPQAYQPPMFRTNNRFGALTDHSSAVKHSS